MKSKWKQLPVILLLTIPAFYHCTAQPVPGISHQIDQIVSKYIHPNEPGAAVIVSKNGKIIYHKAFGMASLELNVPMRKEFVFRIASMTKQFIAVSILQLMEKGLLSLNDDIKKFIPDYPTGNYRITIENLLTQTSGIKNLTSIDGYQDFMNKKVSKKELINFFKDTPIEFEPGTKNSYSNSGYILLEYIIETVSGQILDEYMKENIFIPLKMYSATMDADNKIIKNKLPGYLNKNTGADWMSMTQIACLVMSVEDMYKWHQGLQDGKLIKKENLKKAQQPYILKNGEQTDYGYGWSIKELNGNHLIEHGGGINGFGGYEVYFPKEDIFVACLINSQSISEDLIDYKIIGKLVPSSGILQEVTITDKDKMIYAGTYLFDGGKTKAHVINEKGKLFLTNRYGGSKWEMHFLADSLFYVDEQYPFTYTFEKDNAGKVTGIVIRGRGGYEERAGRE